MLQSLLQGEGGEREGICAVGQKGPESEATPEEWGSGKPIAEERG